MNYFSPNDYEPNFHLYFFCPSPLHFPTSFPLHVPYQTRLTHNGFLPQGPSTNGSGSIQPQCLRHSQPCRIQDRERKELGERTDGVTPPLTSLNPSKSYPRHPTMPPTYMYDDACWTVVLFSGVVNCAPCPLMYSLFLNDGKQ